MKNILELLNESCKKIIVEGGASGHMTHVFEDGEMTFSEMKEIFRELFSGELKVEEKCVSPDTILELEKNGKKTIAEVVDNKIKDNVKTYDFNTDSYCYKPIVDWTKNTDTEDWLEISLDDGSTLIVTPNHRIYSYDKSIDVKAENLKVGEKLIVD